MCLVATSAAEWQRLPCTPDSDALGAEAVAQQWRVVDFASAEWDAIESLAYPGMCVTLAPTGEPNLPCSCADLALLVRLSPRPRPATRPPPPPTHPMAGSGAM